MNFESSLNTETGGFHEASKGAGRKRLQTQNGWDSWNIVTMCYYIVTVVQFGGTGWHLEFDTELGLKNKNFGWMKIYHFVLVPDQKMMILEGSEN